MIPKGLKMQKFILRDTAARLLMRVFCLFPMNQREIVFKSDRGLHCSDNPLALFQTLRRLYPDFKAVWVLRDPKTYVEGAKVVKEGSIQELFALATAKYWIDNKRKGSWAVKRKGQIYIQTWHGAIALKKVERDIEDRLPPYYVRSAKIDSARADYFLSGCAWSTDFYRRCFWYTGEILKYGVPRSDVFYRRPQHLITSIRRIYGLEPEDKFVLYAPTFRDDGNTEVYKLDFDRLRVVLEQQFGSRWKVVARLHPNLIKQKSPIPYSDNVLNGNIPEDVNGLIIACDVLITDYSSVMFDGMEAGKTVFLFTPDQETYDQARGFYFPLEELPFPVSCDNDTLMKTIRRFDSDCYARDVKEFMRQLGYYETGHASERILQYVLELD